MAMATFMSLFCCCSFEDEEAKRIREEDERREAADARARAAEAAASRQQDFDQSATGRAANKAATEAKRSLLQDRKGSDLQKDWLS
mmetsp:Transcript_14841/g.17921  ORF Transcript_14841/g.17921 Transcript_14841/m.17921 type:complete len:86 (+) Transcript_14841:73-330(+)